LDRSPDPDGLAYWMGRAAAGMSIQQIAQSFSVQNETTALYSQLTNTGLITNPVAQEAFLAQVYANLFGRGTIDAQGLSYWKAQLSSGAGVGRIIQDIISGAQGNDAVIVANKVVVAEYFTTRIVTRGAPFSLEAAKTAIANVIASADFVTTAITIVDTLITTLEPMGAPPVNDTPVNAAPVAAGDGAAVAEGGVVTVLTGGALSVLGNDADAEGNPLTAALVSGPANGALTLNADETFSYAHDGSETVSDSFTYKANDGTLDGNTVTVAITITPVNDAPEITSNGAGAAASISVDENTTAVTTVTSIDPDGPPSLTYSILGGGDSAKFSIDPVTGVLAFLAGPDFEAPTDTGANNVYESVRKDHD